MASSRQAGFYCQRAGGTSAARARDVSRRRPRLCFLPPPLLQAPLAADLRPMTVLSRKPSPLHVAIARRSTAQQKSRDPNRQNRGRFDAAKEKDHRSAAEKLAPAVSEPAYQTAWSTTCDEIWRNTKLFFCLMMFRDVLEDRRGAKVHGRVGDGVADVRRRRPGADYHAIKFHPRHRRRCSSSRSVQLTILSSAILPPPIARAI
jgi:hypothetical protein